MFFFEIQQTPTGNLLTEGLHATNFGLDIISVIIISVIVGVVLGFFLNAMLGRAAHLIFRPFVSAFSPLTALLRRIKILPRAVAATRPPRTAAIGARAALRGAPSHLTEIEWALMQPSQASALPSPHDNQEVKPKQMLYDFREEKKLLRKGGAIFKWLRIPGGYIQKELTDPFTDESADKHHEEARRFLSRQVDLHVNEKALYEDTEGAVIISLFRNSDRRAFYALDQLRKTINGNAMRLVLILWIFGLLFPVLVLAFSPVVTQQFFSGAGLERNLRLWLTFASMATAFLMIWVFQNLMYANQQRQNTRELSNFLARYLDRISDRFREASATASRAIQGDERDSKKLAIAAQKWIKILIWLPMRTFFLESFVRGVYFQIRRNSGYYMVLGLSLAIFTTVLFMYLLINQDVWNHNTWAKMLSVLYVGLAFSYIFFLRKSVVMEELDQINWLGFDNLNVGKQIDEVVGKYAEDIGLWKGRFDR